MSVTHFYVYYYIKILNRIYDAWNIIHFCYGWAWQRNVFVSILDCAAMLSRDIQVFIAVVFFSRKIYIIRIFKIFILLTFFLYLKIILILHIFRQIALKILS